MWDSVFITVPGPLGQEIVNAYDCNERTRVYTKSEAKRLLRAATPQRAPTLGRLNAVRKVSP